jgi:hypothetical protein
LVIYNQLRVQEVHSALDRGERTLIVCDRLNNVLAAPATGNERNQLNESGNSIAAPSFDIPLLELVNSILRESHNAPGMPLERFDLIFAERGFMHRKT